MGVAGQRYRGLSPTGREAPGVATVAPIRSATGWEPVHHYSRRPIVLCSVCPRAVVNEMGQMRRGKWEELTVGRHRIFRCGHHSEVPA